MERIGCERQSPIGTLLCVMPLCRVLTWFSSTIFPRMLYAVNTSYVAFSGWFLSLGIAIQLLLWLSRDRSLPSLCIVQEIIYVCLYRSVCIYIWVPEHVCAHVFSGRSPCCIFPQISLHIIFYSRHSPYL